MKIAILSDIHANLTAFEAVLDDCHDIQVDEFMCLGDCIGYGPDPEAVVQKIISLGIPTVIGNHELALIKPRFLNWFNPIARQSLATHFDWLSASSRAFIHKLPLMRTKDSLRFVHGFPPQSPSRYLFQMANNRICRIVGRLNESLFFIGHTHEVRLLGVTLESVETLSLPLKETISLADSCRYIVNVGSVGQPRDGNREAKYAIWDSERRELMVRSVPYDGQAVADRIISLGLPARHAAYLT